MRLIQRSDGVWPVIQKLIIIGMCLVTVLPLLWMVTTSFKEPLDIFALPPKIFFKPTLANYPDSMSRTDVIPRYKNTLIVAVSTSVLCMLLGSLSGYALARTKFRGAGLLSYLILASRLFPPIVIVVPMFTIFRRLGLIDTHLGLVIAYSSFVLPYVVWLMRGYFKELPDGIDECALIDGCTPFGAFLRIVVPCSLPSILATTVFAVILCWNEFLFAMVLTSSRASTIPVAITALTHDLERGGVAYGSLTAVGTMIMAPVLLLGLSIQKVLVRGLTMGATKE